MAESDIKRVTRAYEWTQRAEAELRKARQEVLEAMSGARGGRLKRARLKEGRPTAAPLP